MFEGVARLPHSPATDASLLIPLLQVSLATSRVHSSPQPIRRYCRVLKIRYISRALRLVIHTAPSGAKESSPGRKSLCENSTLE